MAIIRILSGVCCHEDEIVRELAAELEYEIIDDRAVVQEVAKQHRIQENKLARTLAGKVSAFENFTNERQRNVNRLKLFLAGLVQRDNLIIVGAAGALIPRRISHVLAVCLIADMNYRCEAMMQDKGISNKEAQRTIKGQDAAAKLWAEYLFKKSPWDTELHDILIAMDKTTVNEAVRLIAEHARSSVVCPSEASRQAAQDFLLAAQVEAALGKEGHNVRVAAIEGVVTITIDKHTLRLAALEQELTKIARAVPNVKEVKTKVGPGFHQSGPYRQFNLEMPSRVLLVDDEKEFVQTLSERLLLREMGTAVVYDGSEALSFVEEETPDVIVLDLKMPGIDGIEVLRRTKQKYPDMEIIILTGHGSEKNKELCLELGAFAYLQKPVDIDKLSETMQKAYKKLREKRGEG